MPSFDIKCGLGGVVMGCIRCGAELARDPKTGNYHCPEPDCGAGSLTSPGGIETTVDGDGNVKLVGGRKPS